MHPAHFLSDQYGQWQYVDAGWVALTGLAAIDALGLGWQTIIHPHDRDRVSAAWQDAITSHTGFDQEYRLDLSIPVWINHVASPVPTGFIGSLTNTTASKTSISHQTLVDLLFEQSMDGLFLMLFDQPIVWNEAADKESLLDYAFEHQRVVRVNQALLDQYGTTESDFLGYTPGDFFSGNLAYGREIWRRGLDAGHICLETEEYKRDGTPIIVVGEYFFIYNDQGHVLGHIGIQKEISAERQIEQELSDHQLLLQKIFDADPNGVYVYDLVKNQNLYVNTRAEAILGFSVSAIQAMGESLLRDHVHPEDWPTVHEFMVNFVDHQTSDIAEIEYRFGRPNGQYRWLCDRIVPFSRDTNGKVSQALGVFQDITERKQTELALAASEARLNHIFNNLPALVYQYVLDPDGRDRFTYLSGNVTTIFEQTAAACLADSQVVWSLVHPDDLSRFQEMAARSAQLLLPWVHEFRLLLPSGCVKWLNGRSTPQKQRDGSVVWDGLLVDVSDRKQMEFALRDSETRFRNMTANIPGAIFRYLRRSDGSDSVLYMSPGCYDLWELKAASILIDAKPLWAMVHPDDFTGMVDSIVQSAESLEAWHYAWRITTPSGKLKWLEASGRPQRLENGDTIWDTFILDVSDRKRLELELNENLSRFEQLNRNVPAVVYRFASDRDGNERVVYLSERAVEVFEVPIERCLDDIGQIWSLIHPDDMAAIQALNTESQRLCQPWNIEFRIITPSGQQKWLEVKAMPTRNEDGTGFCDGVMIDITERKEAELAIQVAQRQFQTLAENSPDIIERFDLNLRHLYISPSLSRLTGVSSEQFIGKTCQELGFDPIMTAAFEAAVARLLESDESQRIEFETATLLGRRSFEMVIVPERNDRGGISSILCISRDVTAYQDAMAALTASEQRLATLISNLPGFVYTFLDDADYTAVFVSDGVEAVTGYTPDVFTSRQINYADIMNAQDNEQVWPQIQEAIAHRRAYEFEYRIRTRQGGIRWVWERGQGIFDEQGTALFTEGFITDITSRKQAELILQQQIKREHALNRIVQAIRDSLDITTVFETATREVLDLFELSSVAIVRYFPNDGYWRHLIECHCDALVSPQPDLGIPDPNNPIATRLKNQEVVIVSASDIDDPINRDIARLYSGAWLLLPLIVDGQTWGSFSLFIESETHIWQFEQVELARTITAQLAIAIQQAELHNQLHHLNRNLLAQVEERTAQLQTALDFEALLQQITEKVRNSLDEDLILQTVVEALGAGLSLLFCNVSTYVQENPKIRYIYGLNYELETILPTDDHATLYAGLQQGQSCQLSVYLASLGRWVTVFVAPVRDDNRTLGDILVMRQHEAAFTPVEIRLVEQVASQCAIALRQSRLYRAAQKQVEELQRLNQLKDDFLSTVSHELRTPMTSIKLATQMLSLNLEQLDVPANVFEYVRILHDEGAREIRLINDLLDLARLEAGANQVNLSYVDVSRLIQTLVLPLQVKMQAQQQRLTLQVQPNLPLITTDAAYLERILGELLHNACKYTPANEAIAVEVAIAPSQKLQIQIMNTGVAIPEAECDRIFEKFYRLSSHDPWKHGGTGLGLALVKKMVDALNGQICAISATNRTTFNVILPIFASTPPAAEQSSE